MRRSSAYHTEPRTCTTSSPFSMPPGVARRATSGPTISAHDSAMRSAAGSASGMPIA